MNQTQLGSEVRKSITRNMSVMMGAQVITWVTSFVLLYFLPRYLGSEDFGRLYLALSIKMMLGLMIDFGGNYLIPKEVARSARRGSKILNSYILLRIGLWMLAMGLILLLSDLLGYSDHVHLLIIILAIGKLWEGGGAAIGSYFLGIERMEYPSLANIFEKVFVAGLR
jgi:O-antigen/teichoic acid export membrane protein